MKKVIISGATSMIGIALTKFLIKKNIYVTAIIRENSTRRDFLPKTDRNNPKLQYKNIATTLDIIELCKNFNCRAFIGAGSQEAV